MRGPAVAKLRAVAPDPELLAPATRRPNSEQRPRVARSNPRCVAEATCDARDVLEPAHELLWKLSVTSLLTGCLNTLEENPMNAKYIALALVAVGGGAASAAPAGHGKPASSKKAPHTSKKVATANTSAVASAAPAGHGKSATSTKAPPTSKKAATANTSSSGPRVVGTWDGTSAFAFADNPQPVYALSLTNASYTKQPGSIETDSQGFQCVELAMRYFNYRKHIPVASWGGINVATDMCQHQAPGVTVTSQPLAGDLVVLKANDHDPNIATGLAGHVAIVTGVRGDTISTFNQNWANDRTALANVSHTRDVLCFLHAVR